MLRGQVCHPVHQVSPGHCFRRHHVQGAALAPRLLQLLSLRKVASGPTIHNQGRKQTITTTGQ